MHPNRETRSVKKQILRCMFSVAMLFLYATGQAARAGSQIIDDISYSSDDKTTQITFSFTIPVHYQWHFPRTPSNEIMVSLLPVRGGQDQYTRLREHVSLPDGLKGVIDEIQLDGTEGRGILLLIHAKNPIKAEFSQGKNANSIVFSASNAQLKKQPDIECEDKPSEKKKDEKSNQ